MCQPSTCRKRGPGLCLHGDCWGQASNPSPGPTPDAQRLLCGSAGPELKSSALHSQPVMLTLSALLLQECQPSHFGIRFVNVLSHGCMFISVTFWGRRGHVVRLSERESTPFSHLPYYRWLRGWEPSVLPLPTHLIISLLGLVPQPPCLPGPHRVLRTAPHYGLSSHLSAHPC